MVNLDMTWIKSPDITGLGCGRDAVGLTHPPTSLARSRGGFKIDASRKLKTHMCQKK